LNNLPLGFSLSFLGSKYDVTVKTQLQQDLSVYLKEKPKMDMAKFIVSPMPGAIVSILVKEGQTVAEGADVAVVEAMKMQNVLRTTSVGKVKKIGVKEGSSVSGGDVIIEFE
jgi:propionyl-CoA carboxylase alpha chain